LKILKNWHIDLKNSKKI